MIELIDIMLGRFKIRVKVHGVLTQKTMLGVVGDVNVVQQRNVSTLKSLAGAVNG